MKPVQNLKEFLNCFRATETNKLPVNVIPIFYEDLTDWFDIELNNYCTTNKIM